MATSPVEFAVDLSHSKWGAVKLNAEPHFYAGKSGEFSYVFNYPDGSFMGELDAESGGSLGHPNIEVNKFISMYKLDLLELDLPAYEELERLLRAEIRKYDPEFFLEGVPE